MIICQRCSNKLAADTKICPSCGAHIGATHTRSKLPSSNTQYGQGEQGSFGEPTSYENGYTAQPLQPPTQQTPKQPPIGYARVHYGSTYHTPPFYAASPQVTVIPGSPPVNTDGAMAAEIILSLFGLFGVGWFIGGEKITGVVLLLGSILLYWPLVVGGTIFTDGLALICLGPLAIIAIIINALLLHHRLVHKVPLITVHFPATTGKQHRERRLALPAEFVDIFQRYQQKYHPNEELFVCTDRNLNYILNRAVKAAEINKRVTLQLLRDTFAVQQLRTGTPPESLREKMGLSGEASLESREKYRRLAFPK